LENPNGLPQALKEYTVFVMERAGREREQAIMAKINPYIADLKGQLAELMAESQALRSEMRNAEIKAGECESTAETYRKRLAFWKIAGSLGILTAFMAGILL
jgi:hypothetical protein